MQKNSTSVATRQEKERVETTGVYPFISELYRIRKTDDAQNIHRKHVKEIQKYFVRTDVSLMLKSAYSPCRSAATICGQRLGTRISGEQRVLRICEVPLQSLLCGGKDISFSFFSKRLRLLVIDTP